MRSAILLMMVLFMNGNISAQELRVDLSYTYVYSNQWDKAIQTYNFSRPQLAEKQPLLIHGFGTSAAYIFPTSNRLKQGVNLSYSYIRSQAENPDFENTLHLHFLNVGYLLTYGFSEQSHGLYTDFTLSATTSGIFRTINGDPIQSEESTIKGLGAGVELQTKWGYRFKSNNSYSFSPFVSFGFTPFLYSPRSEAILNQTIGLSGEKWTSLMKAQVGVSVHWNK